MRLKVLSFLVDMPFLMIVFLHGIQIWLSPIFLFEGFWVWREPKKNMVAVLWRQWYKHVVLLSFCHIMVYFNYIALHLGSCFLLLAVGETIQVGNFDPKIATFWIDSGNAFCFCCLLSHILLSLTFSWMLFAERWFTPPQANWKEFSLKVEVLRYDLNLFRVRLGYHLSHNFWLLSHNPICFSQVTSEKNKLKWLIFDW